MQTGTAAQLERHGRDAQEQGGIAMVKVKTFTNELRVFRAMNELAELDEQVNKFIEENGVKTVISVSDAVTQGEGSSCGIIRALAYEAV